jgi:hypothetical protein
MLVVNYEAKKKIMLSDEPELMKVSSAHDVIIPFLHNADDARN